jgi:hypothetical protein
MPDFFTDRLQKGNPGQRCPMRGFVRQHNILMVGALSLAAAGFPFSTARHAEVWL